MAAFGALAGSAVSLAWLDHQQSAAPLPSIGKWDESAPLVVVDAGHGGHDGGAVSHDIVEKDMALDLANRLRQRLQDSGLKVLMTRSKDVFLPLAERAELAARHSAAAFVSVHLNTDGEGSDAQGIETYYAEAKPLSARQLAADQPGPNAASADLAMRVQESVCSSTGAESRGTKARNYLVVMQGACPAVLVECGFLTSKVEAAKLKRETYRDKVAAGIAQGVELFLQTQPAAVASAAN